MTSPSTTRDNPPPPGHTAENASPGPSTTDPTDSDHPTGTEQAAENAANESPA